MERRSDDRRDQWRQGDRGGNYRYDDESWQPGRGRSGDSGSRFDYSGSPERGEERGRYDYDRLGDRDWSSRTSRDRSSGEEGGRLSGDYDRTPHNISRNVGEPRRRDEYRGPSEQEEYRPYSEGNLSGYGTERGQGYRDDSGDRSGGWSSSRGRSEGRSDPRSGDRGRSDSSDWRSERFDSDRGRETQQRFSQGGREGDWEQQRFSQGGRDGGWDQRSSDRGGDQYLEGGWSQRGREQSGSRQGSLGSQRSGFENSDPSRYEHGRDNSATWRQFQDWGNTSYGQSREQGLGWRRTDDYGDQFWSQGERDRNP